MLPKSVDAGEEGGLAVDGDRAGAGVFDGNGVEGGERAGTEQVDGAAGEIAARVDDRRRRIRRCLGAFVPVLAAARSLDLSLTNALEVTVQ